MKTALSALALLFAATAAVAAPPEHYLHVKVDGTNTKELVRVNIPLSLAEKVIPAINSGQLRDGKIQMGNFRCDSVDLQTIINAVKSAPDGEFVTVQEPGTNVRVAKERGQMIVHVTDKDNGQKVDVTIPWEVAEALASATHQRELNIEAAIQALDRAGDTTLVTVTDNDETVRVWIDSRNSSD
ncbi:MAG: hypothetical protein WAN10_00465 [Candidatus Acidiferrales bacterium]